MTLSEDKRYVRLSLPPLPIEGLPEPARVNMDFDAGTIDQIIERLSVLRARMLPASSTTRPTAPCSSTPTAVVPAQSYGQILASSVHLAR